MGAFHGYNVSIVGIYLSYVMDAIRFGILGTDALTLQGQGCP